MFQDQNSESEKLEMKGVRSHDYDSIHNGIDKHRQIAWQGLLERDVLFSSIAAKG